MATEQITITQNVTASLSDPDRGPYFAPQPTRTIWVGSDPSEAARIYYEQSRRDCSAHPSGFSGITTSVSVPAALRAAFDAALAAEHDSRDATAIVSRLPSLPDGWDAAIGTQHDPEIIALRSRPYRETSYGDVVFLRPGEQGYVAALSIIEKATT